MRRPSSFASALVVFGVLSGCGASKSNKREPSPSTDADAAVPDDVIVRARWTLAVGDQDALSPSTFRRLADARQPISATVVEGVTYTVSNARFITPAPVDVASYGGLDVTDLRDNQLRVCGPDGRTKCQTAALRIYTEGTPGAGLWNTADGYGLPILSEGDATVGLDAAGALTLATADLSPNNVNTVRLAQFTSDAAFAIPVSVDFTNAGAGAYESTIVVEYVLY